jgi:hypothetical protein
MNDRPAAWGDAARYSYASTKFRAMDICRNALTELLKDFQLSSIVDKIDRSLTTRAKSLAGVIRLLQLVPLLRALEGKITFQYHMVVIHRFHTYNIVYVFQFTTGGNTSFEARRDQVRQLGGIKKGTARESE